MVWSKIDFAREVRRQLVELESIRKRAPADAELHERIDRLEESHHHVLRKLAESSAGSGLTEKKARRPRAAPKCTCEGVTDRTGRNARVALREPMAVKRRMKSLLAEQLGLPHPAERCASCGRVLLLSLIAGGQIVFHKAAWYHRSCVEGSEGLN
jgi:hypothetical protein